MKKIFEDRFMEIQEGLISLCLEVTEGNIDKVYAYASIEKKSAMFNAFFEKNGRVVTINQLNIDSKTAMNFLRIGTMDLSKLKAICEEYEVKCPTEIKLFYDVKTGKCGADYRYDEICSSKTGLSSGEVFLEWYNQVKDSE